MTAHALKEDFTYSMKAYALKAPLWVYALAALAVFSCMQLSSGLDDLALSLGDTDDATRLVGVRDLMAGAPWFDTTLPRFGAPDPLVSHWSRLVDAPLALLISIFSLVLTREAAETAVRITWPLIVFLPLLYVLARHSALVAGRAAGVLALGFAIYAHSGVVRFGIGNIDHHNIMIAATVSGILLLAESFRSPRMGVFAGALLGLSTAVGYEALVLNIAALSAGVLFACWTAQGLAGMRQAAIAFALTLCLTIAATIPIDRWLLVACDALSANLAVLAAAGAIGVLLASRFHLDRFGRLAMAALPAVPALAIFAWMEPACLAGPFGQVDLQAQTLWLSNVQEVQSLWQYFLSNPRPAAQYFIVAILGLSIAAANLRRDKTMGNDFFVFILALATALSFWQIKLMPYATFLAVPPLAIFVARLKPMPDLSKLGVRLLGFFILNQHTILIPILLIAKLASPVAASPQSEPLAGEPPAEPAASNRHCYNNASILPLAALTPGLLVTDVDFGPFIVALTPHRVLSAPYHRMDKAILATVAIKSAEAETAREKLREIGANYVAICTLAKLNEKYAQKFFGLLYAGTAPDFLEPIPLPDSTPFKVWRVKG